MLLKSVVAPWSAVSDQKEITVDVETSGRRLDVGFPLTNLVGRLVALFPVVVKADANADDLAEALSQIPHNGASYGWLRQWGSSDIQNVLNEIPQPLIRLNYLGRIKDQSRMPTGIKLIESPDLRFFPNGAVNERMHPIEIDVSIVDQQFHWTWTFPSSLNENERIQRWIAEIRESFTVYETRGMEGA